MVKVGDRYTREWPKSLLVVRVIFIVDEGVSVASDFGQSLFIPSKTWVDTNMAHELITGDGGHLMAGKRVLISRAGE